MQKKKSVEQTEIKRFDTTYQRIDARLLFEERAKGLNKKIK